MELAGIKEGQEFKNLKEICEFTGIQYKNSTNSRNAILKELERFLKLHKDGRKLKVAELYAKPKPKIDNRKGNSGKSKGSRNNYKGIYAEYIDVLLIQYLQEEELKLKNTCQIYTTNNKIAEATGIINCNYRTAFSNQEKFYNIVKKDFNIHKNTYCMRDVFYWTKTKIREIVKASLDRLQKAEKLEYETCYFVYIPYQARTPTEDEMKVINIAEEETMQEMGVLTKKQIDNDRKMSKEFNRKVLIRVQEQFAYIDSIFKGYTISLWEDFELKTDIEIKELKFKLNQEVLSALIEKPQKIQDKTIKDEGLELWFGARSPFWKPWVFDRMSKKYIEHCNDFIHILVDLEAIDIVNKIKNCRNKSMNNKLTNEEIEEYKDKILINLMDSMDLEDIDIPY